MDEEEDIRAATEDVKHRRTLRAEQRELESSINNAQFVADGTNEIDADAVNECRRKMNAQFNTITHTREQLQDAEVLKTLSRKVYVNSNKLSQNQSKYEFDTFTQSLLSRFNEPTSSGRSSQTPQIFWEALGRNVMPLFLTAPSYQGFASNIEKESTKVEATRVMKAKEDLGPEMKPMLVHQSLEDSDSNELNEASSRRIQRLHETVQEAHAFDLLSLLVDSKDAVQSVENFFDYAFLIKDKKVSVEPTEHCSQVPITTSLDDGAADEEGALVLEKQQHVLTLGIKDLRRVGRLLELLESQGTGSLGSPMMQIQSQHSSSSYGSSSASGSTGRVSLDGTVAQSHMNRLHRGERLYSMRTAQEQAAYLETMKAKTTQGPAAGAAGAGAGSSSSSATGKRKRG
jgi:hypothetical protein